MKIQIMLALTALLFTPSCGYLSGSGGLGSAKNPVEQLVSLCSDNNLKDAARHMRYPGMDASKKDLTANYDSTDPSEKRQVEMMCNRAKSMSGISYTVSAERQEQGLSVFDVEMKASGKSKKELWAFKKTGSDYVLVDID